MGTVERGVVKGSNDSMRGGDHRANGYLPLSGGASTVHPANQTVVGDRRAGSFPLTGRAPITKPPDHRFNVDQVRMPQPGSAIEPGKGAIPVNPFMPGGAVARVMGYEADEAKPK